MAHKVGLRAVEIDRVVVELGEGADLVHRPDDPHSLRFILDGVDRPRNVPKADTRRRMLRARPVPAFLDGAGDPLLREKVQKDFRINAEPSGFIRRQGSSCMARFRWPMVMCGLSGSTIACSGFCPNR
jgi:hypothetical protein